LSPVGKRLSSTSSTGYGEFIYPEIDDELETSRKGWPMQYHVLVFDAHTHPQLADNVWNAQMGGHPKLLTYAGPDVTQRAASRNAAVHFEHGGARFEIPHELSRDEYPFACTIEGGRASWVGHIPGRQNSAQGGLIAAFLRRHQIVAGRGEMSKFVVGVRNHRNGPVTKKCLPACAGCVAVCRFTLAGGLNIWI
jgi:Deoxyribonuclease NucA/NucB